MKKTMKMSLLGMASVAALTAPVALVVSCGNSDDNGVLKVEPFIARDAAEGSTPTAVAGTYKAQLVLDGHDHAVFDHAFNQAAYEAVDALENTPINGTNVNIIKGDGEAHSAPNAPDSVEDFKVAYDAAGENTIMVLSGFMHIDPLISYGNAMETNKQYAILLDGDVKSPRIASVNFQAHQAAFEAGVLAGHYLNAHKDRFGEELKVATFGGLNIPTVAGSMAGFQKGIEYFNAHNDGMTDVIFMDNGSKADYFSGGFAPGGGKTIADKLVAGGADLIFPVAGGQTVDVRNSIIEKKSSAQIIGVDTPQEENSAFDNENNESLVAFSALKNLTLAATSVMNVIAGKPVNGIKGLGEQTLGDLDNHLVGLSQPTTIPDEMYAEATNPTIIAAAKAMKLEFNY